MAAMVAPRKTSSDIKRSLPAVLDADGAFIEVPPKIEARSAHAKPIPPKGIFDGGVFRAILSS
jgi:hypothetical protein